MIATGRGWFAHSIDSLLDSIVGLERYWLHSTEIAIASDFRSETRRRSWIGGRVAAKQLLLSQMACPVRCPREIEICSRRNDHIGQSPVARFGDRSPPLVLSISHTGQIVSVAIPMEVNTRTGIDVVELADADRQHLAHWMAPGELAWSQRRGISVAEIWAAKEAAFKTLPLGTSFRPRRYIIGDGAGDGWSFICCEGSARYTGSVCTWRNQQLVIALATRWLGESRGDRQFHTYC